MANFELRTSGHLAVPPGQIWAELADRDRVPGWLDRVAAVGGEGDALLVRKAHRSGWLRGQVVRVDPLRRLALRLLEPTALLRELWVEIALADADGGTNYDICITARPGVLGSLLAPLLRLRTEVALVRAVGGFRAALEDRGERDRARARRPPRSTRLATPEEARLVTLVV